MVASSASFMGLASHVMYVTGPSDEDPGDDELQAVSPAVVRTAAAATAARVLRDMSLSFECVHGSSVDAYFEMVPREPMPSMK